MATVPHPHPCPLHHITPAASLVCTRFQPLLPPPTRLQLAASDRDSLFRCCSVLLRSTVPLSAARPDFTVVRGKGEGMEGDGETPQAGTSDSRAEEQVVMDSNKIEQEEKPDEVHRKEADDKKEEVESRTGEWFQLTGSCALVLHRGDITTWCKDSKTDAIVNAANEMMLGGGGVDGAIHRAAGKKLLDACFKLPEVSRGVRCPVGSAVITPGFKLPVSRVIHTVGPMYHKEEDPAGVLGKAYTKSVSLAKKSGVKFVAFPAISCGIYGYPYEEAAKVSIQALQASAGDLLEVHFVLFEAGTYAAWLAYAEEELDRWTP